MRRGKYETKMQKEQWFNKTFNSRLKRGQVRARLFSRVWMIGRF